MTVKSDKPIVLNANERQSSRGKSSCENYILWGLWKVRGHRFRYAGLQKWDNTIINITPIIAGDLRLCVHKCSNYIQQDDGSAN